MTASTSKAPAEVRQRLTREEATDAGLVPANEVWDEQRQEAIPRGMAVAREQQERPLDLAKNLETWKRNRDVLIRFIGTYLEEAEYDKDRRPLPGRMHDYYILPGYDKKTFTKQGAEKTAGLFNLRRAAVETIERTADKDFASAVVRVRLVDQYRREAGAGEAACSTAEQSFRSERTKKKYGGDYRAALNDVIARAGKRAFVQALIYAIAGDELFDASGESEQRAAEQGVEEEQPRTRYRLPEKIKNAAFAPAAGKYVDEVDTPLLIEILNWCQGHGKPEAVRPIIDAIGEELDGRQQGAESLL